MQIEFKDDYNETTYYFGTVKEPESTSRNDSDFVVEVVYFSSQGNWTVSSIEWVDEPEDKYKAEERITEMVMDWHKGRCFPKQNFIKESHPDDCMITYDDPGDEND